MGYRDYKEFAPGETYHIYNRGNGKMDIFKDDQDYRNFLARLSTFIDPSTDLSKGTFGNLGPKLRLRLTAFDKNDFSMLLYCAMPNHFHICLTQNATASISSLMLRLCTSYARYFNAKYEHVGHVFQDQFSAVRVETDRQLAALSAYVHLNPVHAGLVRDQSRWQYSSYATYLGSAGMIACNTELVMTGFRNAKDYERFVADRSRQIREGKAIMPLLFD